MINGGGGVPIQLIDDGFDTGEIKSVSVTLISNKSMNTVIAHKGNCFKPISKNLESHTILVDTSSQYHQAINYNSDVNPLYVLPNTLLTYNVTVNTTSSSDNGCIYLYLFDDLPAYTNFLFKQDESAQEYYNKSYCIPERSLNYTIVQFLINEANFIYVGIEVNTSTTVQINITVTHFLYDKSQMSEQYDLIPQQTQLIGFCKDFCIKFSGKKQCIIIESQELVTVSYVINFVNVNEMKGIAYIGIIFFFILLIAEILLIVAIECYNKRSGNFFIMMLCTIFFCNLDTNKEPKR